MCECTIFTDSCFDKFPSVMGKKYKYMFKGGTIKMPVYIFSKQYLHIQAAWCTNIRAASGSSIGGSNSLLCCPPHWQGGSLGCFVWVWQLSAPWHLSACCSPRGTYRCRGCALHICLSGKIELFLSRWNMHHARKFRVMEIHTGVAHWRCLRLHWML